MSDPVRWTDPAGDGPAGMRQLLKAYPQTPPMPGWVRDMAAQKAKDLRGKQSQSGPFWLLAAAACAVAVAGTIVAFQWEPRNGATTVLKPPPRSDTGQTLAERPDDASQRAEKAASGQSPRHGGNDVSVEIGSEPPAGGFVRREAKSASPTNLKVGFLTINSLPWAQVFVDGKKVGTTPVIRRPLKEGRHKVDLLREDLGLKRRSVITVEAGKTTRLVVKLQ